ncbi:MAG: DNA primase [Candidatus Omnitrophica bacterium 4484_70.1]|nr:MAG: DNA primase [Candidatus Omnitrophica bacterium 4484_70.1]
MIPQEFIEEVQAKTDIVELISSYFPLKRAGRNFKALCPFHSEKTPSFFVSPQKQIFHCFGCGEGGGPIQFLMLYEKVSFPEAVEILAKRLGLSIPYKKSSPYERLKTTLYEITETAAVFFQKNLFTDEGKDALHYLKRRGIDSETIKEFRLGYAPSGNVLLEFMRNKGYSLDILEKASLVVGRREGGYVDLFRERIVFPIFDVKGKVVGFGARLIKERNAPKYINSIENPLYNKRAHLYGLNFSKEEIIKKDVAIIVEGYFDMISPYVKGIKNIVASLGTALTLEQIYLIRRYTKNIVLVFDADSAGQLANLRALDLLLENGLDVNVVRLPQGFDPDSLVRERGKDYFFRLLQEKEDFFEYKIGILEKNLDIESIEGKTKLVEEILTTLSKIENEVKRYGYIKKLSSYLEIPEEVLILELKKKMNKTYLQGRKISFVPIPISEKVVIQYLFTCGERGRDILKY